MQGALSWKIHMRPTRLAVTLALAVSVGSLGGERSVFAAEPRAVPELGLATEYATQPVVAEVARAQLWEDATLRLIQHPAMPLDRVWAAVDALAPSAIRRHRLAPVVTAQLASFHAVGASGALKARDIRVADLAAGEALALGWLRLLALDTGQLAPQASNQGGSGARLTDASPLDLLAHAAASAPDDQTPHVALCTGAVVDPTAPHRARQKIGRSAGGCPTRNGVVWPQVLPRWPLHRGRFLCQNLWPSGWLNWPGRAVSGATGPRAGMSPHPGRHRHPSRPKL
jgi:hypothetical protein